MQKFFLPLPIAAALLCPFPAQAQTDTAPVPFVSSSALPAKLTLLTLPQAIGHALAANPELAAGGHAVRAATGASHVAAALPNPELSLMQEDVRQASRSTTLQLSQQWELGGKRAARIALAQHEVAAAANALALKKSELRATVSMQFYAVLIGQERQRLASEAQELAQRARHAAERQVKLGKIAPLELNRASLAETTSRAELAQARLELSASWQALALSMGTDSPSQPKLEGQFDTLPKLPDLSLLLQHLPQSPQLQGAQIELEQRGAQTQLEKSRQTPDLTISLGSKRESGRNQALFGVSMSVPLFDRNQGQLQQALSRADQARAQLQATRQRLQQELTLAYQRLQLAREQSQILQSDVLPASQQAFEMAIKGFEYGKFNFLDVLDAQRSLLQAKTQYLHNLHGAHRAAAEIESLLGIALTSLPAALSPAPSTAAKQIQES